jgi:phage gpG-like protein
VADVTVNTDNLVNALHRIQHRAPNGAKQAAQRMSDVGERAIKLELSRSSHSSGTKTPSKAYVDPPSLISGRLRESVRQTRLYQVGMTWIAHVAPTTVYARIQELGGWAGWQHKSHLPPRPYVRPALNRWSTKARDAAVHAFHQYTMQ